MIPSCCTFLLRLSSVFLHWCRKTQIMLTHDWTLWHFQISSSRSSSRPIKPTASDSQMKPLKWLTSQNNDWCFQMVNSLLVTFQYNMTTALVSHNEPKSNIANLWFDHRTIWEVVKNNGWCHRCYRIWEEVHEAWMGVTLIRFCGFYIICWTIVNKEIKSNKDGKMEE